MRGSRFEEACALPGVSRQPGGGRRLARRGCASCCGEAAAASKGPPVEISLAGSKRKGSKPRSSGCPPAVRKQELHRETKKFLKSEIPQKRKSSLAVRGTLPPQISQKRLALRPREKDGRHRNPPEKALSSVSARVQVRRCSSLLKGRESPRHRFLT